jgi:hypothetical protein
LLAKQNRIALTNAALADRAAPGGNQQFWRTGTRLILLSQDTESQGRG